MRIAENHNIFLKFYQKRRVFDYTLKFNQKLVMHLNVKILKNSKNLKKLILFLKQSLKNFLTARPEIFKYGFFCYKLPFKSNFDAFQFSSIIGQGPRNRISFRTSFIVLLSLRSKIWNFIVYFHSYFKVPFHSSNLGTSNTITS